MHLRRLAGLLGLASIAAPGAQAATATTTFQVLANVQSTCIAAATDLNFGNVGVITAPIDQTSTITVTCTNGTTYNVGLNAGTGTGATLPSRKMVNGTNLLNYTLFRDTARTQIWGTTVGTDTVAGAGNGNAQNLTVYGRILAPQTSPPPGLYTDTITVTVTY